MLCRLLLVEQATVLDCQLLDFLPPFDDGSVASEVDIGGCQVADAFVISAVVVEIDDGVNLAFKMTRQVIILQQDAVFQRLVPAPDFALGLRMVWRVLRAGLS